MKKVILGLFLVACLFITVSPVQAANIGLKIDQVSVTSDVAPEARNNRIMVPLRVVSENIGVQVDWKEPNITLSDGDTKVILTINSNTAIKNGEKLQLDVKLYLKNNRTMVPLRFLAEAFGSQVSYKNRSVMVETEPLVVDGVKVKTLQIETPMTMGSLTDHVYGNAYINSIHNIFIENTKYKVNAPDRYVPKFMIAGEGDYYVQAWYDFLDEDGNIIKSYDIYNQMIYSNSYDEKNTIPKRLMYVRDEVQWYEFSFESWSPLFDTVRSSSANGFQKRVRNDIP